MEVNMQKRHLGIILANFGLAMVMACAPGLGQQSGMGGMQGGGREGMRRGEMEMGTVTSVGVGQIEIKKQDGSAETVVLNDKTRLVEGRQAIQLEDLKPGDHVMVRGQSNDQNQFAAFMVRRVTPEEMERFQNRGDRAFGRITSINGNEIKVQNRRGEQTIEVSDQTTFMKDGKTITLQDLKVGDRVFAQGKLENGQLEADRVSSGNMRRRGGMGMGGGQQPPPDQPQP
jgi:hypothetical protein